MRTSTRYTMPGTRNSHSTRRRCACRTVLMRGSGAGHAHEIGVEGFEPLPAEQQVHGVAMVRGRGELAKLAREFEQRGERLGELLWRLSRERTRRCRRARLHELRK